MGNKHNSKIDTTKKSKSLSNKSETDLPIRLQLYNNLKSLSPNDIHSYLLQYTAIDCKQSELQLIDSLIQNVIIDKQRTIPNPISSDIIPTFVILKSILSADLGIASSLSHNISLIIIDYIKIIYLNELIGYWKLTNFDGLKDLSNSKNNIKISYSHWNKIYDSKNECIYLSNGKCIDIPNVNNVLNINKLKRPNNYSGMTIAMWVNKQGDCDGPLFCYRGNRAWNVHVWLYTNSFMSRMCGVDRSQFPECARTKKALLKIELNKFYFVTVTYNRRNGDNNIYVNGKLEASVNIGVINEIGTIGNIALGEYGNRYLNAKIKGIQVYNKALDENEILQIMEYDRPN
eukprot:430088_1